METRKSQPNIKTKDKVGRLSHRGYKKNEYQKRKCITIFRDSVIKKIDSS